MTGIYADNAHAYRLKGYSPVPLPPGKKVPPPAGWTGYAGTIVSGADIQDWSDNGKANANIALRLPQNVVGFDLDDYDGKPGLATMLAAVERLGALPKTWTSTSRPGTVSGIRFYRVPEGRCWADVLGDGVEVIHHGHRYAVGAPSLHPEGRTYVWIDQDGNQCDAPSTTEFPELPEAWVKDIDCGSVADRSGKANVTSADVREWLAALPDGEPCRYVMRLREEASELLASSATRHDHVRKYNGRMVRAGDQGHHGVRTGLDSLYSIFLGSLKGGKARTEDVGEWNRMVTGAVAMCAMKPTPEVDKGCCGAEAPSLEVLRYVESLAVSNDGERHSSLPTEKLDPRSSDLGAANDKTEAILNAAAIYAQDIADAAYKIKVRDAAVRKVAQDRVGAPVRPVGISLADFLDIEDEDVVYRVDRLWPKGGRVILAAQYKAGKSTLMGNALRSLADGQPLLGAFASQPAKVALIDNELDEGTLRRWLRDQDIENTGAVQLFPLRGKVSSFDILDPETRADWAEALTGYDVIFLDCLRPVLDALGLSEDKDAGRFLVAFDALLYQAGAAEAAVVHHMGHSGERSRGDSRILDWPDATWKLVREDPDDPGSTRYFSAFGRDVEVAESKLSFDPISRRLTIGGGSRKDSAADEVMEPLIELLDANPDGMSGRAIENALVTIAGHRQASVRAAINRAKLTGLTSQSAGEKRAILHKINPSALSALPSASTHRGDECVSASLKHTHSHHAPDADEVEEEEATHTLDWNDRKPTKLICRSCHLPMMIDDGTGTHPTCEAVAS